MWPFMVPIAVVGFISLASIMRGPFGKALAERIAGRVDARGEDIRAELDEVEHRLEGRIMELEDRLDFAERMLQQRRHDPGLPPATDSSES